MYKRAFLLYLPIVFFFFPAFSFYMPGINGVYNYFYVFLYITVIFLFLNDKKNMVNSIINITRKTPLKWLFLSILVSIIASIIMLPILKSCTISKLIKTIFLRFVLCIFPIIFYFIYIIGRYISVKKFLRIFIFIFWCVLLLGMVAYIGQLFDITIINNLFDFFANARELRNSTVSAFDMVEVSNYKAFGLPRLDNLYEEPGGYAQFLFLFMPFVYTFSQTKLKIFKNHALNKIIKSSLVPLTWVSLILTMSPIFLVFCCLITIIYYWKNLIKLIYKKGIFLIGFLGITCIFTFLFLQFTQIDLSETYLSRIIKVLSNANSVEGIVEADPSLGSRIVSYINMMSVFLKHPFLGIGLGNIVNGNIMYAQLMNSPVALPNEIYSKTMLLMSAKNEVFINANFIYLMLAETGIFTTAIFIYFYYKTCKSLYKIMKVLPENTLFYALTKSTFFMLICIAINSFYNLTIVEKIVYFVFAIAVYLIYTYKKLRIHL